jgi:plastocyanin
MGTIKGFRSADAAGAVVYVDTIPGRTFPAPAAHARIELKSLRFEPHVLPIVVGTTVDILNSDVMPHYIVSPDSCAGKLKMGSWPRGEVRSHVFKTSCVATLLCTIHPEMEAFVLALPTPYFATADASGGYVIHDLPNAGYTIRVWHARSKGISRQVNVSGATKADFDLVAK